MKHIISFSGGLGSFMCAHRVISSYGKKNVVLLFTDTLTEDEDLYRFLNETSAYLEVPLTRIAYGKNIWQVFNEVKFMANSRIDPCSRILKRELAKTWVKNTFSPSRCKIYVGIGWNEINRVKAIKNNWSPFKVGAPMTKPPYVEKSDILKFLENINIKPPRLYEMGFQHNNCGGFCVKAGQAQFKLLLEKMPERYAYHEKQQEELFKVIGKHGFLQMMKNGEKKYLSLKEFREYIESNGKIDPFDIGGCGCFI